MQQDGYDPHLALAMFAGELSARQVEDHKAKRANYKPIRQVYKSVNYACVYGARPPTVARTAKCSVDKAEKLVDAYWRRNWAVLRIAEDCVVKVVKGQKWLFNPVSKFWYSLRYEKDRFSTLNQGTGVYCFDTWIKHIRAKRKQLTGQMHDEVILCIKKGNREKAEKLLREAIDETNKELNLNVKLNIDIQFGDNYSEIH
jgi:DNA polymerase I-like protein with 3'-5' exonuclease and polymerase domains